MPRSRVPRPTAPCLPVSSASASEHDLVALLDPRLRSRLARRHDEEPVDEVERGQDQAQRGEKHGEMSLTFGQSFTSSCRRAASTSIHPFSGPEPRRHSIVR
jgi:hypothetical protein